MSDKTELWSKVQYTEGIRTKKVTNGARSFNAIDAHYQLLVATKLWGAFGGAWGIKNESFHNFKVGQKVIGDTQADIMLCQYSAIFFYPNGEFPISSATKISYLTNTGKHKLEDDYAKKVATDALTKGLSKLGFSADVFMGAFDGNKYDGIDDTGIDMEATSDQIKIMMNLKKTLESSHPDTAKWIDKVLSENISFDQAKKSIVKLEEILANV